MATLPAFAGYGIELEYAIVDRDSLDVRPLADSLLSLLAGHPAASVERGALGWSNELVSHVIELKINAPAPDLADLPAAFQAELRVVDGLLSARGARLMPTGMHPWMDPRRETVLWPHEGAEIYATFDRIFDCSRHGWANLQSMHVNLPFASDEEFARLHAAIRAVLPLVPALAASSPIADGVPQAALDYRLEVYRGNALRVPSIVGDVIPPRVDTRAEYETRVLAPMYHDIARLDPGGVLQREWLNARGAIARFDRHAIEIRLCDTQECPRADMGVAAAIVAVIRALYNGRWAPMRDVQALSDAMLVQQLRACIARAEHAMVESGNLLAALGLPARRMTAGEAWARMVDGCAGDIQALAPSASEAVSNIVARGTLAARILRATGHAPDRARLRGVYERLCDCLVSDRLFMPA